MREDKLRKMKIVRWKETVGLGWLPTERIGEGEMGWRGVEWG